ncbi:Wzz/FepE/Etk N-terminal domain-containing protein [Mumia qirimensis]|uniref:Wzz/FepE/Etk N-terminal domain-containing protein n=1 Tax=Mumia qirimensis TaxID=3234852 RepID=UPI00351CF870
MSVPRTDADVEFSDYGSIIRRRWVLVVLGLVAGVAVAVLAIALIPKTYTSTASVMVQPTGQDGTVANGRTSTPINLDTEAQIVKSTVVSQQVIDAQENPIETDPRALAKHVMVTVPPNTSVLNISFSASTPEDAQAGAEQYAETYLASRKAEAESRIDAEARSIQAQLDTLQARLKAQSQRIARLPENSPERVYEISQRDLLVDQIAALNSELVRLTSTEIMPGDVITEAQTPTTPTSPNIKILGASGVLAGLLAGLLIAVVVDRADKRVRDRRDLERLGLDSLVALVEVPAARDVGGVVGTGRGTESLRQLRNALLARIPEQRAVVLVAGASNDSTGSAVAVSLAATLARSGVDALLVSANSVHCAVTDVLGDTDRPGLADILHGRVDAPSAIVDVPQVPGLRAMSAGSDGSLYSELLQSHHVKTVLGDLADQASVLVVDVAPTGANADAQSLAAMGAGVLVVASAQRTNRAEVVDAIDQLRHVSASMLGAVVAAVQPEREASVGGLATITVDEDDHAHGAHERVEREDEGADESLLVTTLVDVPAIRETDLGDPVATGAPAVEGADGVDDELEDDEDEQRPVYIHRTDAERPTKKSRYSLSRSGAASPPGRDNG